MSSKKDKLYMRLALNLASERYGLTGPNPSVGCVIVKNEQIISVGQTGLNGRPHAEFNAIKNCKKKLEGSTIYVSLEPCSHSGKTPPCTNLIIKNKIKKVFFAINDKDKRSFNKAKKILNSKKISVKRFLLKNEARNFYKSYFFSMTKNRPYVTGKIAKSKDDYIFSRNRKITNNYSLNTSHLLRYTNQGILISANTLNSDNPKLTCRIKGLENFSPKRFILDKNLICKNNLHIIETAKKIKTYIFYNKKDKKKIKLLKKAGIFLIHLGLNKNNHFDLSTVLKKINTVGIKHLLVEGGKKLTMNFLESNFFNQFYLFKSNKRLGIRGKLKITNIVRKLPVKFKFHKKINTFIDKDELIHYY